MLPALEVALLYLAPVALLVLMLLSRRYPGERMLERLAGRARRPARRVVRGPRPRTRAVSAVAGGVLLAAGLAGRAPPVPAH